jgi:general secretion pathway protein K
VLPDQPDWPRPDTDDPDPHVGAGDERRERGFALVVVIWLGVLLALIAAAFTSSVVSRMRSTAATADIVRGEAAADVGIRLAMIELLNPQEGSMPQRFVASGPTAFCGLGSGTTLAVRVEDEDGKINLNTSNREVLSALFAGLGAKADDARRYAERVMDFRDADNDQRPDGAEASAYSDAKGGQRPKNANFESVDELDQVLGIPNDIRMSAKNYLSVAATADGFDPAVAPQGLRTLMVRGAGGIVATTLDKPAGAEQSIESDLPSGFGITSRRQAYRILSEARLETGARYASDAIITLPSGPEGNPVIHRWRRGTSPVGPDAEFPAKSALPPC